jgi:hypothetical protein
MTMKDPIVEEARAAGKAYIDSFKGNRKAMLLDLRRREEKFRAAGHKSVPLAIKTAALAKRKKAG